MSFEIQHFVRLASYTDIHLNVKDPAKSVMFRPRNAGGNDGRSPVPEELRPLIGELAQRVSVADKERDVRQQSKSFMVTFGEAANGPLCYRTTALRKEELYAMRLSRASGAPVLGKDVVLEDYISREMLSEELKRTGGLIVINGIPGSGKTWSAMAVMMKRLELYGGYCLTIEDPPEMNVEGWVGEKGGYIEQMDATTVGYRECVATSLRCFPAQERAMMFIGEIREPEPAAEMLRIALGGHLVFTTVHAENHAAACQRIVALAQMGGEPDAKRLLANSFRISLNQRLEGGALQSNVLKTTQEIHGSIINGDYSQFANRTSEQNRKMSTAPRGMPGMRMPS